MITSQLRTDAVADERDCRHLHCEPPLDCEPPPAVEGCADEILGCPAIISAVIFFAVCLLMSKVSLAGWQLFLAITALVVIYFAMFFWYLWKTP